VVEPFSVFPQFPLQPSRELPEMVNELPVQVLNAPLHLALILRIRRVSVMRLNPIFPAPPLPRARISG